MSEIIVIPRKYENFCHQDLLDLGFQVDEIHNNYFQSVVTPKDWEYKKNIYSHGSFGIANSLGATRFWVILHDFYIKAHSYFTIDTASLFEDGTIGALLNNCNKKVIGYAAILKNPYIKEISECHILAKMTGENTEIFRKNLKNEAERNLTQMYPQWRDWRAYWND